MIALLIALLAAGGGVAVYEVRKHNRENVTEQPVRVEVADDKSDDTEGERRTEDKPKAASPAIKTSTTTSITVAASSNGGNRDEDDDRENEDEDDDDRDEDGEHNTGGSTTPVTPPPTTTTTTSYTMAEVKLHNTKASCWTAVYGNVYDVTSWISRHPGGSAAITSMCGTDGTSSFDDQHGGQSRANAELGSFKIGVLK